MKIKTTLLTVLFLSATVCATSLAQDNAQNGLPEYAIAKFGKGGIHLIQFSPDGKQLAVATDIGVWLYDVTRGAERPLHTKDPDNITAITFSLDSKILACGGSTNQIIQLWDLDSDNRLPYLTLYDRFVHVADLVFAKDNKTLYSLSKYGYLTKWSIEKRREVAALQYSETQSIATFDKNGKMFVQGDSTDSEIWLWDIKDNIFSEDFEKDSNQDSNEANPKLISQKQQDKDVNVGIETLTLSPDNKMIACAHDDNIIQLWDPDNRTLRFTLKGHTELIYAVAFSADNEILASSSADNTIKLWDIQKGTLLTTLTGHTNSVKTLSFSPTDKTLLASGSSDGTIRFWNTPTSDEPQVFAAGHTESIKDLSFTKDDTNLAWAAENGTVQIWNIAQEKAFPSPLIEHIDTTMASAFSHDATLYAYHGADTNSRSNRPGIVHGTKPHNEIKLSVLPTGDPLSTIPHGTDSLTFSPDNKMLAFITQNTAIKIWNIETQLEISSFNVNHTFFPDLVFSPNGEFLAINNTFQKAQVWSIAAKRLISPPNIHDTNVLTFSPDSSILALRNRDGIHLWKVNSEGLEFLRRITVDANLEPSYNMIFSPDGNMLLDVVSVGRGHNIRILEVDSGKPLLTLSGHLKAIVKLVFSHNGKTLASGSEDGIVLLWDWEKLVQDINKKGDNK